MCGQIFSIYSVHIPRKCIESVHFYWCPSPPFKTPGRIFWKSVSPKTKWVEETMIFFIKIQSENVKMTWNITISLFIFCIICNYSKCDGFTVLWIISIKWCGIKFIASSYVYNHAWQFDTKITEKITEKIKFKAGSLSRKINEEWLAQFIYKPT